MILSFIVLIVLYTFVLHFLRKESSVRSHSWDPSSYREPPLQPDAGDLRVHGLKPGQLSPQTDLAPPLFVTLDDYILSASARSRDQHIVTQPPQDQFQTPGAIRRDCLNTYQSSPNAFSHPSQFSPPMPSLFAR